MELEIVVAFIIANFDKCKKKCKINYFDFRKIYLNKVVDRSEELIAVKMLTKYEIILSRTIGKMWDKIISVHWTNWPIQRIGKQKVSEKSEKCSHITNYQVLDIDVLKKRRINKCWSKTIEIPCDTKFHCHVKNKDSLYNLPVKINIFQILLVLHHRGLTRGIFWKIVLLKHYLLNELLHQTLNLLWISVCFQLHVIV